MLLNTLRKSLSTFSSRNIFNQYKNLYHNDSVSFHGITGGVLGATALNYAHIRDYDFNVFTGQHTNVVFLDAPVRNTVGVVLYTSLISFAGGSGGYVVGSLLGPIGYIGIPALYGLSHFIDKKTDG